MSKNNKLFNKLGKEKTILVFLGGVHGVGKTTLCNEVFKPINFYCVTASSLIKEYGLAIQKNKQVNNIEHNQVALIEQLNKEKKNYNKIALDGHFCLINNSNKIEPIEIGVFRDINPKILILLQDCPVKITKRLVGRDKNKWNTSLVEEFQNREQQHAQYISNMLNIPLHIIDNRVDE